MVTGEGNSEGGREGGRGTVRDQYNKYMVTREGNSEREGGGQ